jgi:thiopurine S-methyltransferase
MGEVALTPDFWLERWQKGDIGFHQAAVHDFLTRHWARLAIAQGAPVFVPLCGKSRDMVWLAAGGHRIVGVELSPLAVDEFFKEQGLDADTRVAGSFVVRSAGPFTIWCGDIFELPAEAVGEVAAAYDRASLVAFPPTLQQRYAQKLADILPVAAPILLVSLAYPEGEMSGPPFTTPLAQVVGFFGEAYEIRLAESRSGLEQSPNLKARGVTALDESAYVLTRKAG